VAEAVSLKDAPARFLNVDWGRLVELKGSEAKAIETLSKPDPAALVHIRREVIADGQGGAKARAEEEIFSLVEKMIADFRALATSGQIAGQGIHSGTGLRQIIPSELWSGLQFDFSGGAASGAGFSFSFVMIEEARPRSDANELVATLVAWLQQRQLESGVEPRKVLEGAAKKEFVSSFRAREFSEAYKRVYERSRGRPRRSEK